MRMRSQRCSVSEDPVRALTIHSRSMGLALREPCSRLGTTFKLLQMMAIGRLRLSLSLQDGKPNLMLIDLELGPYPSQELSKRGSPGTTINIRHLHDEISERIKNPSFFDTLYKRIGQTYTLFDRRFCKIRINGRLVQPVELHVGNARDAHPSTHRFEYKGCQVSILAGLAPRDRWQTETAGWSIFCNGRAVLFADKTALTGWDNGGPKFVSKFRGFQGLVFFFSKTPEQLTWTTTKTDVNEELLVYQKALTAMLVQARPVLRFLSSLYGDDEVEAESAKAASAKLESVSLREIQPLRARPFKPPTGKALTTTTVQFSAKTADVLKIKKHVGEPTMSNREIGELVFSYYLKNEVGG